MTSGLLAVCQTRPHMEREVLPARDPAWEAVNPLLPSPNTSKGTCTVLGSVPTSKATANNGGSPHRASQFLVGKRMALHRGLASNLGSL